MSEKKPSAEKTRDIKPFGLRLLPELKKAVEDRAAENGRSLNAEIAFELEAHQSLVDEVQAQAQDAIELRAELKDMNSTWAERVEAAGAGKLGIPVGLYKRVEAAAAANNRFIEEEIAYRLEDSFEATSAMKDLGDLFIDTMKANAENARREVEEYRHMVATIKLMRFTIDHLAQIVPTQEIPEDILKVLSVLSPKTGPSDLNPMDLMLEVYESMERRDALLAEEHPRAGKERFRQVLDRVDAIIAKDSK